MTTLGNLLLLVVLCLDTLLSMVDSQSWAYDAVGNPSTGSGQTLPTRIEEGVTFTQEWDAENRLVEALNGHSGEVTTLAYDADGQRVKKTVGNVTTYYLGDYYELSCQAADVDCSGTIGVVDIQAVAE